MHQRSDQLGTKTWLRALVVSLGLMGIMACSTNSRVIELDAPPTNVSPEIPSRFARSVPPPVREQPELANSDRAWELWYNVGAYYYFGVEVPTESSRSTADVFPETEYTVE